MLPFLTAFVLAYIKSLRALALKGIDENAGKYVGLDLSMWTLTENIFIHKSFCAFK